MHKNLKRFLMKALFVIGLVILTRALFQFPIEYFNWDIFDQSQVNRAFSKIDLLKVITLVAIFFGLFFKERISEITHPRFRALPFIGYMILAQVLVMAYYGIRALTNMHPVSEVMAWILWLGIVVILGLALASVVIAVFQRRYVSDFTKAFRKEIIIAILASVILYNVLIAFQNQWLIFSRSIGYAIFWLLSPFFDAVYYMGPIAPVLEVGDFGVAIGAPCSGIDSMLLFFAFFSALFALDYHRLRKISYGVLFVMGLGGVVVVNILRLYLLILVGIYISPRFAVGLFHTNAGWIFFVAYFLLYFLLIRRFIYKKAKPRTTRPSKRQ